MSVGWSAASGGAFIQGFRLVAWFFGALMIVSGLQLMPAGIFPRHVQMERYAMAPLWPQWWSFYAGQLYDPVVVAYRIGHDGSVLPVNFLQLSQNTDWGLSRTETAQYVELANFRARVSGQSWVSCAELGRDQCLSTLLQRPPIAYLNNAKDPTVCGHVLLVLEKLDGRGSPRARQIVEGLNMEAACT